MGEKHGTILAGIVLYPPINLAEIDVTKGLTLLLRGIPCPALVKAVSTTKWFFGPIIKLLKQSSYLVNR